MATINGIPIVNGGIYDFTGQTISSGFKADGLQNVTFKGGTWTTNPVVLTNASGVQFRDAVFDTCDHWMLAISGGTMVAPGNNVVDGCVFTSCNDVVTTQLAGWGNKYVSCHVKNVKGRGLQLAGCNHQIIDCEISYACSGWNDIGAIYLGNASGNEYGHQVIGCHIHDIQGPVGASYVNGIYADAHTSGCTFKWNRLERILTNGIALSGGRDNLMQGNVMIACKNGIQIDDRNADAWPSVAKATELSKYQTLFPNEFSMTASHGLVGTVDCYTGDSAAWAIGNVVKDSAFISCKQDIYIRTASGVKATSSTQRSAKNVTSTGNAPY